MNTQLLQLIISLLIGTVVTVNGVILQSEDIINSAKSAANGANLHQLATVVELYYSNHDAYPNVSGGEALVDTLESEGYIRNRPLDPTVFKYEPKNNGQDYELKLLETEQEK